MADTHLFTFPVSAMHFCAWLEPVLGPHGADSPKKFGMAFPTSDVPDEMADLIPAWMARAEKSRMQVLNVLSNARPSVHDITDSTANLIYLRQQLDALNITLESAVRGSEGEASVMLYPIRRHTRMPDRGDLWGMSLIGVRFDAAAIHVPTWADVIAKAAESGA